MHRKSWTEQLGLGYGHIMELKLIKNNEALWDLAGQRRRSEALDD